MTMKNGDVVIETDGDVHNVVAMISDLYVVLACDDCEHAEELKEVLDRCAWTQIERR